MESPPKASREHYRRMFTLEVDYPVAHHGRQAELLSAVRIRYGRSSGKRSNRWQSCSYGPRGYALIDQTSSLGESAEQYTQAWKRTLELATQDLFGSSLTRSVTAIIGDRMVVFGGDEAKFDALVEEWRRLRELGSSTAPLINDAYGQIVAMGWSAVPFLLREVKRKSGHWFTALKWITGENLVKPEMRGNIREIREAWLRWEKENGRVDWHRAGRMDEEEPSQASGSSVRIH